MQPDSYCREIETYLCRKNDGHLVRLVGPAFDVVMGWAAQGVPFKVACRGIDRYFERYYAKGPRRRPVRVEFCDADVLDAFDEWKRAVGGTAVGGSEPLAPPPKPSHSLRAHLDRTVLRLTDLQAKGGLHAGLEAVVERTIEILSSGRDASRTLRGEGREDYLRALERLDAEVLDAARQATPPDGLERFRLEAADELAAYRDRMAPADFERAVGAAADRLLRDHWKLPVIAYRA